MADSKADTQTQDNSVLAHIKKLVSEEQKLLHDEDTADTSTDAHAQLQKVQVELDQYWDLLRQRRALRDAGENPDAARLRDSNIVENYEN